MHSKPKAIGVHVFAGGFTMGVREIFDVPGQLEIFDLGQETVQSMDMEVCQRKTWQGWSDSPHLYKDAQLVFGNPRCTGFSCMTAGYDETSHGAFAKQTKDIHDLCEFAIHNNIPLVCWESVQQAWSVGRELLTYLGEKLFWPNRYRIAHLFVNAATFGNAQHRKRYFFMAYKDDKNFNIMPPDIVERHTTVGDILATVKHEREPYPCKYRKCDTWDADAYKHWDEHSAKLIPYLPKGYDVNMFARVHEDQLEGISDKLYEMWMLRMSDMPFSMHSIVRLNDESYCPVIAGTASRFIHPTLDRPCTIRELSALMGWPLDTTPIGENPIGQLGKGIVPDVGIWLAQQAQLYLDDYWGDQDWDCQYDDQKGEWVGTDYTGHQVKPPEKVFELTRYCPPKPDVTHKGERKE